MRILKVHNYYTQPGGEDSVLHAEIALLRSKGHEVFEYFEFNKKIEQMNKASVALQTPWSQNSYNKFKIVLKEIQPDIAHFHNTFPLISPSAYYACQELNIPVVQTLDNQRLICPASTFYRNGKLCLDCLGKTPPFHGVVHACYHDSYLQTAVIASMLTLHQWLGTWRKKVDAFLCSTNFFRDIFVRAGFPPDKIVVMPHFVRQAPLRSTAESTKDYALFIGRLDPEKGVSTLLEAWRFLEIPLIIRGGGRLEGKAKEFVEQNAMLNVEFIGRLGEQELSDLICGARFLIMPSEGYYETFGMVIVEAFARNVPVIASNIGVVPELVSDKKTGLLFEPGNPVDLAEKAVWLWNHPEEAKSMGRNGYKTFQDRFTEDICYKTLTDLYEGLMRFE